MVFFIVLYMTGVAGMLYYHPGSKQECGASSLHSPATEQILPEIELPKGVIFPQNRNLGR
jgi:hypothetical protein